MGWKGKRMESGRLARALFPSSRDEGRWVETKEMTEQRIFATGGSWCYKGEDLIKQHGSYIKEKEERRKEGNHLM